MMRTAFALLLLSVLTGCVSPVAQFYQGDRNARLHPQYDASETTVRVFTSDNLERDGRDLMRRGYVKIGQASFNAASSAINEAQVREQAAAVGAHVVLVAGRYSHTASGATPLTIPTRATSYSTGTATAYGPGGAVTAFGSGTTTTYGNQVVMVPYSVERSDFAILFFAKAKSRVGIFAVPIDDATRRRLETNAGLRVEVVVDDSPAFHANVLPGDVLISVAGESVSSMQGFVAITDRYEGQRVPFDLDRDGKRLSKEIEIRKFR